MLISFPDDLIVRLIGGLILPHREMTSGLKDVIRTRNAF